MDLREQINIDITQPFFALYVVLTQQIADFRFFQNKCPTRFWHFSNLNGVYSCFQHL